MLIESFTTVFSTYSFRGWPVLGRQPIYIHSPARLPGLGDDMYVCTNGKPSAIRTLAREWSSTPGLERVPTLLGPHPIPSSRCARLAHVTEMHRLLHVFL